jgi:hypothetical protein
MEKKQNWYVNKKKYHFIYKTTCKINSKYYLGMHSTDNLEDGYIGSGTRLWHSIKKHRRENFSFEVLEFLSDRESLKKREAELVNVSSLIDPLCMNLKLGGEGGWYLSTDQYKQRNGKCGKLGWKKTLPLASKARDESYANGRKGWSSDGITNLWSGRSHSAESKEKIGKANSVKQQGEKNSQYGTCWIFSVSEKISKKIKKEEAPTYIENGWSFGRFTAGREATTPVS